MQVKLIERFRNSILDNIYQKNLIQYGKFSFIWTLK